MRRVPLLVAVNCPLTCFLPLFPVLQLPWNDFLDQSYMVTHIVFTSNNWYMAMSLHAHDSGTVWTDSAFSPAGVS